MISLTGALLVAETIRLITLHSPQGQVLSINALAVVQLREPQQVEGHFPKGTHCIVNTSDGKHAAVAETCEVIGELLEEAEER